MFDVNEFNLTKDDKAVLVSIVCENFESHKTDFESKQSLIELRELLRTLDIKSDQEFIQQRKHVDPATIIGSGKLSEIAEYAKEAKANVLVFDFELTSSQARNIADITKMKILDRCNVILQIFANHARTSEARIQIEISRLQYMLPRLTSLWTHFTRQKGGIGLKGEGEQQLELDRRRIRSRIEFLKEQLEGISTTRNEQKKRRQDRVITTALLGYTNAGKSSLMNRLCKENVLEEDKLFATLDSTFRTLTPDTKPPMILIDTVGFISNLPNTLINGFKSTLESANEADLLAIVVDISDPNYEKHLEVTENVLKELKIDDKPKILIFNKKDLLANPANAKVKTRKYESSFIVSSYNEEDMKNLREYIINYFLSKQDYYDLFIPYERGDLHATLASQTNILNRASHDKGIFYRVRVPSTLFSRLGVKDYILSPEEKEKLSSTK